MPALEIINDKFWTKASLYKKAPGLEEINNKSALFFVSLHTDSLSPQYLADSLRSVFYIKTGLNWDELGSESNQFAWRILDTPKEILQWEYALEDGNYVNGFGVAESQFEGVFLMKGEGEEHFPEIAVSCNKVWNREDIDAEIIVEFLEEKYYISNRISIGFLIEFFPLEPAEKPFVIANRAVGAEVPGIYSFSSPKYYDGNGHQENPRFIIEKAYKESSESNANWIKICGEYPNELIWRQMMSADDLEMNVRRWALEGQHVFDDYSVVGLGVKIANSFEAGNIELEGFNLKADSAVNIADVQPLQGGESEKFNGYEAAAFELDLRDNLKEKNNYWENGNAYLRIKVDRDFEVNDLNNINLSYLEYNDPNAKAFKLPALPAINIGLDGNGSTELPFLITSSADLKKMRDYLLSDWELEDDSKHAGQYSFHIKHLKWKLANDFSFPNSSEYLPVDNFEGTLIGDGRTIYNFNSSASIAQNCLIRKLSSNGLVEGLNLKGNNLGEGSIASDVEGKIYNSSFEGSCLGGGICNRLQSGKLQGCSFKGTVNDSGGWGVGGICGILSGPGIIADCSATGTIVQTGTGSTISFSGGICGALDYGSNGIISRCSYKQNSGDSLTGTYKIGGIVGSIYSSVPYIVRNCYADLSAGSGIVQRGSSIASVVGGIIGETQKTCVNCYFRGQITTETTSSSARVGPIISYIGNIFPTITEGTYPPDSYYDSDIYNLTATSAQAVQGRTSSQLQSQSTFPNWDFFRIWQISGSFPFFQTPEVNIDRIPDMKFLKGEGTKLLPFLVENFEDLKLMGFYQSSGFLDKAHWSLENDIIINDPSYYGNPADFPSIREDLILNFQIINFLGVLYGNNKTIKGLCNTYPLIVNLNSETEDEDIIFQGAIQDLIIKQSYFASNSAASFVNTIGGNSLIDNCSSEDCIVDRGDFEGKTGGFVNNNLGIIKRCQAINCQIYNSGTNANPETTSIGGFCGHNSGTISECFAIASISAYINAAGFCGFNEGEILKSYCSSNLVKVGTAANPSYFCGFCVKNSNLISNCYSSGEISAEKYVYGFNRYNSGIGIKNCYTVVNLSSPPDSTKYPFSDPWSYGELEACFWNSDIFGSIPANYSAAPLTDAQMKTNIPFISAGWDFGAIWAIGNSYPYLYFKNTQIGEKLFFPYFEKSLGTISDNWYSYVKKFQRFSSSVPLKHIKYWRDEGMIEIYIPEELRIKILSWQQLYLEYTEKGIEGIFLFLDNKDEVYQQISKLNYNPYLVLNYSPKDLRQDAIEYKDKFRVTLDSYLNYSQYSVLRFYGTLKNFKKIYWTGAQDNNFHNAYNWFPKIVPSLLTEIAFRNDMISGNKSECNISKDPMINSDYLDLRLISFEKDPEGNPFDACNINFDANTIIRFNGFNELMTWRNLALPVIKAAEANPPNPAVIAYNFFNNMRLCFLGNYDVDFIPHDSVKKTYEFLFNNLELIPCHLWIPKIEIDKCTVNIISDDSMSIGIYSLSLQNANLTSKCGIAFCDPPDEILAETDLISMGEEENCSRLSIKDLKDFYGKLLRKSSFVCEKDIWFDAGGDFSYAKRFVLNKGAFLGKFQAQNFQFLNNMSIPSGKYEGNLIINLSAQSSWADYQIDIEATDYYRSYLWHDLKFKDQKIQLCELRKTYDNQEVQGVYEITGDFIINALSDKFEDRLPVVYFDNIILDIHGSFIMNTNNLSFEEGIVQVQWGKPRIGDTGYSQAEIKVGNGFYISEILRNWNDKFQVSNIFPEPEYLWGEDSCVLDFKNEKGLIGYANNYIKIGTNINPVQRFLHLPSVSKRGGELEWSIGINPKGESQIEFVDITLENCNLKPNQFFLDEKKNNYILTNLISARRDFFYELFLKDPITVILSNVRIEAENMYFYSANFPISIFGLSDEKLETAIKYDRLVFRDKSYFYKCEFRDVYCYWDNNGVLELDGSKQGIAYRSKNLSLAEGDE